MAVGAVLFCCAQCGDAGDGEVGMLAMLTDYDG